MSCICTFNDNTNSVGSLIPSQDNTLDLGSASKRWRNLYYSNRLYTGTSGQGAAIGPNNFTGADDDVIIIRSEKTNNFSYLAVTPNGAGSQSIRSGIDIFGTDRGADATNYERLWMRATDNAGTPNGYQFNVDKGGTGSLRSLKFQMGGNDVITIGTDSSVTVANTGTPRLTIDASGNLTVNGTLVFADARNVQFNTTTGTKIGTATGQKIGFWNATPTAQLTATGSRGGNAALASLLTQLATMGLIVDGTTA